MTIHQAVFPRSAEFSAAALDWSQRLRSAPCTSLYLYHIACNHPFVDGNKRAGAMAAYVFLDANGYELTATESEFEQTVLSIAAGVLSKDDLTDWFEDFCPPTR
jgi:hypothetical protein